MLGAAATKSCECGTWPKEIVKFPSLDTLLSQEEFTEYLVEAQPHTQMTDDIDLFDGDYFDSFKNWLFALVLSVS